MAFQRQPYSVNYDNIEMLRFLGVDVIFIEKEGIVEKLTPFTTGLRHRIGSLAGILRRICGDACGRALDLSWEYRNIDGF